MHPSAAGFWRRRRSDARRIAPFRKVARRPSAPWGAATAAPHDSDPFSTAAAASTAMHDKRTDQDLSRPIARQTARRAPAHVEDHAVSRPVPFRANPHECWENAHCRAASEGVARRLRSFCDTAATAPSAHPANSTTAVTQNNMEPKTPASRHGRLIARRHGRCARSASRGSAS